MGKVENPTCQYGDCEADDAFHTFFECSRWYGEKTQLESDIGQITPENIVAKMTTNEENWRNVSRYIQHVLITKSEEHADRMLY